MIKYPIDFPSDAARVVITNFKDGKIVSDREGTVEAAWNLIGYGLKMSVGSPPEAQLRGTKEPSDEEVVSALETWESQPRDEKLRGFPLSPQALLRWSIQLALKIIEGNGK